MKEVVYFFDPILLLHARFGQTVKVLTNAFLLRPGVASVTSPNGPARVELSASVFAPFTWVDKL
jgi:hypothetical protein